MYYRKTFRKEEASTDTVGADELTATKKEIISLCGSLGGTKNEELMTTLKSYVANGNPNAITDLDAAKECLAKIKEIKPVEA